MVELPRPRVRGQDVLDVGQGLSVRQMRQRILAALEGPSHDLVLDMRGVDHLSNKGLALLCGVRARQHSRQRTLTLVCGSHSATEQALSRNGMGRSFRTVTGFDLLPAG